MSNAMADGIRDGKGNSLSPEPCALIPNPLGSSFSSIVTAVSSRPTAAIADATSPHCCCSRRWMATSVARFVGVR